MAEAEPRFYEFGPFRLDVQERLLARDGSPIPLTDKVFELLVLLVRNRGRALTKVELMDRLWPDTVVEENNLTVNMSALRKALGESPSERRYIETLPRRGYRFIADVVADRPPSTEKSPTAPMTPPRAFVGREQELSKLEAALEGALAGRGGVVFVTGSPGMGKTELCERLRTRALERAPLLFAAGHCFEHHGAKEAYAPFLELIGALLSRSEDEAVRQTLKRHAPTWYVQFASALGDSIGPDLRSARDVDAARMLREMADALEALAQIRPLLLVLEDLHWADPSSLDLLRVIAHRVGGFRALVLGTFRAEHAELENPALKKLWRELLARGRCEELALPLLGAASVAEYIDAEFAGHALPPELGELVHRRTEGQPLFATRLVQLLVERGDVTQVDGRWVMNRPLSELELGVPSTVRGLIEGKFESVDEADRRALEYASVAGVEFSAAVLAALLGEDEVAVDERLNVLARRHRSIELLGEEALPGGRVTTRYRFVHSLYQNVLYEGLAIQRRAALHGTVAEQLSTSRGASAQRLSTQIATHFERARNFRRAIEFWMEAADQCARLYADAQAAALYRHALGLVEELEPDERVALRIILLYNDAWTHSKTGDLAGGFGGFREMLRRASEPEFTGATEQAERARNAVFDYFEQPWRDVFGVYDMPRMPNQDRSLGPSAIQCEAYWGQCYTLAESNRLDELGACTREYLRIAEASNNEPRKAEALAWMAARELRLVNFPEAVRLADESTRLARATGHSRTLGLSLHFRARAEQRAARYEACLRNIAECLALNYEAQARVACLLDVGRARTHLGDVDGARAALEESRGIAELKAQDEWMQSVESAYGELYRETNELDRAERHFRAGLALAEKLRSARLELHFLVQLAHVHALRAEIDRARETFERAERLALTAASEGRVLFENPLQRHDAELASDWARAELALAVGELDVAEKHGGKLLETARPASAVRHVANACHLLARVALGRGDVASARTLAGAGLAALEDRPAPFVRARLSATLGAAGG